MTQLTPAAGGFGAVTPTRILDTRSGVGAPAQPVPAGATVAVKVTGISTTSGSIPASGVAAVAVNLIALSATRSGYITGWANGTSRPHSNIINFTAGQSIDNEVILPVGADGKIALYNGAPGTVQLIADIAGYYTSYFPLPTWTASGEADHVAGAVVDATCADPSTCLIVEGTHDKVLSFDGSTWHPIPSLTGRGISRISCSRTGYCMAVGTTGTWVSNNKAAWTRLTTSPLDFGQLSCVSATFCMALRGSGSYTRWNGTTWASSASINPDASGHSTFACSKLSSSGTVSYTCTDGGPHSLSCAAATYCVAVNGAGKAAAFNGTTWSTTQQVVDNNLYAISCPTTTFCMAMSNGSGVYTVRAGVWSKAADPGTNGALLDITCWAADHCVVLSCYSSATWNDGAWLPGADMAVSRNDAELPGVYPSTIGSCPSATFCFTVDGASNSMVFDGSKWSAAIPVAPGGSGVAGLSCVPEQCMVVDKQGRARTGAAGAWSDAGSFAPVPLSVVQSVSCASTSFCMATDNAGNLHQFDGTTWTAAGHPLADDGGGNYTVSCASKTLCVTVSDAGDRSVFNGSGWSAPVHFTAQYMMTTLPVSCARDTTFCAVGDTTGHVFTLSNGTWSAGVAIDGDFVESLTCGAVSSCLAILSSGRWRMLHSSGWSSTGKWQGGFYGGPDAASCVTATFCAVVGSDGFNPMAAYFDGTAWHYQTSSVPTADLMSCSTDASCTAVGTYTGYAFLSTRPTD